MKCAEGTDAENGVKAVVFDELRRFLVPVSAFFDGCQILLTGDGRRLSIFRWSAVPFRWSAAAAPSGRTPCCLTSVRGYGGAVCRMVGCLFAYPRCCGWFSGHLGASRYVEHHLQGRPGVWRREIDAIWLFSEFSYGWYRRDT